MGTTAALKELETNEIFCEDKIEGPCGPVKGIYARERTFLALKAERLLIRTLVDTLDGEADAKKLGLACKRISAMKTKSHNLELVGQKLMMMMSNKMFYNDVGDDETSQSVRTGLIVPTRLD